MKPQVFIKEPCSEDWHSMTSNKLGRHCSKCEKTVVDFTKWDQVDIHNYMTNNQNVCGRFQTHQLNNPKYKNYQLNYSRIFLYSSLLTALYLKPYNLNGTVHGGISVDHYSSYTNFYLPIGKDSFGKGFPTTFSCIINTRDSVIIKSVFEIEIQCADFKLKLQSDSTGNFQFSLPKGIADTAHKLDVIIGSPFLKDTIKFTVYSNNINKNIILNGGQFQFDLKNKLVLVRESIPQKWNSIQLNPESFLLGFSTLPNIPAKPIVVETLVGIVGPNLIDLSKIKIDSNSNIMNSNSSGNIPIIKHKHKMNKNYNYSRLLLGMLTLLGLAFASVSIFRKKKKLN